MRRLVLIPALMFAATSLSFSQDKGFGLGIILGEPTGLSAKYWLTKKNAIDGGIAWSFKGSGFLHVHGDYLWHFPNVFKSSERFVLYTGPGIRFGGGKRGGVFGIRVAGGIEYWPKGAPVDIFVEIAPIVDLAPSTRASFNAGIGVRYFFE